MLVDFWLIVFLVDFFFLFCAYFFFLLGATNSSSHILPSANNFVSETAVHVHANQLTVVMFPLYIAPVSASRKTTAL